MAAEMPAKTIEKISYQMPTFRYKKNIIYFGSFSDHYGIFPGSEPIVKFKEELKGFKTSKGTIQLPLDKPFPVELIKKIIHFNLDQVENK